MPDLVAVDDFDTQMQTAQHADRIVVSLLSPLVLIRDPGERQIVHFQKPLTPDLRAPDRIQYSSIAGKRHGRKIVSVQSRLAVLDELVKDLIARSDLRRIDDPIQIAKGRKFILKTKCASTNALSKFLELLACPLQISVRGPLYHRGPIPNAVQDEIELDPFMTFCGDATSIQSPSSHRCSVYPALNGSA